MITVYTDGSVLCRGKNSPGGYAFLYYLGQEVVKGSGGLRSATNNTAEMIAVIAAFESLLDEKTGPRPKVMVVSDSRYVVDGMTLWLDRWKATGWRTAENRPVMNRELWEEMSYLAKSFKCRFQWVRGHDGHVENEIVDGMAKAAAFSSLSVAA
jgi:ribonuclease HI